MMCGWSTAATARASRAKRCRTCSSPVSSFSATVRPRRRRPASPAGSRPPGNQEQARSADHLAAQGNLRPPFLLQAAIAHNPSLTANRPARCGPRPRERAAPRPGSGRLGFRLTVPMSRREPWEHATKDGTLAIASATTRQAAKDSLARLRPRGGTAIGKWLRYARELFEQREDTLRHAILLTDGQNGQLPGTLAAAIEECQGVFSCDCRGVGTDWEVSELRKISAALLGTVDIVPDPAGLAADFEAMMTASMAKEVADVALRVWTPQRARIRFVKQVAPAVEDLTARRVPA